MTPKKIPQGTSISSFLGGSRFIQNAFVVKPARNRAALSRKAPADQGFFALINTCRPSGRAVFRLHGFCKAIHKTVELSTKSVLMLADCSLQIYVSLHRFLKNGVKTGVDFSSSLPHEKPALRNRNPCACTRPA